jgi:glycosyltransferase involved in cell wall biosynthesis
VPEIKPLSLTAIVPVSSFRDDSERLALWISRQEIESFNVIIVFDGLEPPVKLKSLIQGKSQIRLLNGQFGGPGPSRNAGLKLVTTQYVCFWDSDDYPFVERYSIAHDEILKSQGDVAIAQFEMCYEDLSTEHKQMRIIPHLDDLAVELTQNPGIWRFIFSTSSIQGIEFPDIPMGEDQVFISRYFSRSRKVTLLNYPIYRYVKHADIQLTKDPISINRLIESTKCIVKEISTESKFGLELSLSLATRQILTILKSCSFSRKISALELYVLLFISFPSLVMKRTFWHFLSGTPSPKRKVYLVLNGGLGNQLFQLAAAIFHSQGRTILLEQKVGYPRVLNSGQATITDFDLPDNIEISTRGRKLLISKIANLQLRTGLKNHRKLRVKLLALCGSFFQGIYLKSRVSVVVSQGVGWWPLNLSNKRNELLIGYFQSHRNQDYQTLLAIHNIFMSQKGAELENLISLARIENPLVVHVRLQDYVAEPNFGIPGIGYYEEAIEHAFNPARHNKIWLFSDDAPQALSRIPEKLRSITRVIEDVDGSDCNTLVAMSHGKDFVIANSSFSWWAARMSVNADAQVHYPQPWFVNMEDPCELVPNEWHSHAARFQRN